MLRNGVFSAVELIIYSNAIDIHGYYIEAKKLLLEKTVASLSARICDSGSAFLHESKALS